MNGSAGTVRMLLAAELRELPSHPRAFHLVPAVLAGILWTAWSPPAATVILPVAAAVFGALEPQYNNMLARNPREREALALFPVPWRAVVMAKNGAAIILTLAVFAALVCTLGYFYDAPLTPRVAAESALYLWTVVFPLLMLGNAVSVRRPRRECGLKLEDLYEALLMLVVLACVSLPYVILPVAALLVYGAAACAAWLLVSVPRTVRDIAASFAPSGAGL